MKTFSLILAGCALALTTVGAEDSTKPGAKGGPKGKGDGSFFKQIDKNGDKAISEEEAGERWSRMSALDKDNDGKVTMQEMMAGRPGGEAKGRPGGKPGEGPGKGAPGKGAPGKGAPGKGAPGKGGPEMFQRADKNGDGKISQDEVPEPFWARLSRLDKDGDNAVSAEEARAGRPAPDGPGGPGKGKGEEMWKRADQNSDGRISKDEVPEQAWARLGRLDTNGDDAVTREEMAAGMAAMRGAKGDGKGKGPGKGGPPQGGPGAVFGRFDKDGDDKLAESEVPAEMWSRLRRADTDADGMVSKEELGKVYEERKAYEGGTMAPKAGPSGPGNGSGEKKKRPELETPAA